MTYEKETLTLLKKSLDEEEDETSIIPILENHHKYLKEYVTIFMNPNIEVIDKLVTARLFFPIFIMHAKAEDEILYCNLDDVATNEFMLHGLKAKAEHTIALELIDQLKFLNCGKFWTEEIEIKIKILSTLIIEHLEEEELILFPLAEKYLSETQLIDMTDEYLEKCKIYLVEAKTEEIFSSEVSKNDVMKLFQ